MSSEAKDVGGTVNSSERSPYPADNRHLEGSFNITPLSFPPTSTSSDIKPDDVATKLVEDFNGFLATKDRHSIAGLFMPEGAWKDHLCLSWDLRTFTGPGKIADFLERGCRILSLQVDRSPTRIPSISPLDALGNVMGLRFFIKVVTDVGTGAGLVKLAEASPGQWKILALYTVLEELGDFPESVGSRRNRGDERPGGKNWLEQRTEEQEFSAAEPAVVIIGAGQAGLAVAARLKMLNVATLVIDKVPRIGDSWRNRYSRLVLHDPVWFDHLPYIPFPTSWPIFTPKDKMANFLEAYAELMELNVWTSTELVSSSWDESTKAWTVTLKRGNPGTEGHQETRTLHPKHIVLATGASGKKNFPVIPGRETFKGHLCHSSDFRGAVPGSGGKKAVIIGCCNSAHDLAQDLHSHGYDVTMVQRSSTCIVSSYSTTEIGLKGLYDESTPLSTADADLLLWGFPAALFKAVQIQANAVQNAADAATLIGLERAGFKVDSGPDQCGLFTKYFERGGGYYIDVGASQMIADGKIKVKQGQEVARILSDGLEFADGSTLPADEIIFATGYQNMRTEAQAILGDAVAGRARDAWGYDEEGEMRTVWRRSGHPGLWFMGGNLAIARFFSRILALQIKALVEGIASHDKV